MLPSIAVFEVTNTRMNTSSFRFVRGCGGGQRFADKEIVLAAPFMIAGNGSDTLVRAAYAALKGLELDPADRRLDVILIEPEYRATVLGLNDHALGLIQTTSTGSCYPEFSPARDQLVFLIDGATHSMMGILTPDDVLKVISLATPDLETLRRLAIDIGNMAIAALTPILEGTFQLPSGSFTQAEQAEFEIGQDHPSQWLDDLQDLFWNTCATTLADPLVRRRSFGIKDPAFRAPVDFGSANETRMNQLINWVLTLNETTASRRKARTSRFRSNRRADVIVTASHLATVDLVPAQLTARNCSKKAMILMQEILNWSWPRGDAPAGYQTNRASSVIPGGAKRRFVSSGEEPTAHEILSAQAGLTEFLSMRRFSGSEIDDLLDLES